MQQAILKKGWFSDLEILEICEQVNREIYEEDPSIQIKTVIIEMHDPPPPAELKSKILTESSHTTAPQNKFYHKKTK